MRVTRDRGAAFEFTFEFADAAAELVVELLLLDELRGLRSERRLGPGEFFSELSDERLLGASDTRFGISNAALDLLEVAEHGTCSLGVEVEEVVFVDHGAVLGDRAQDRTEGGG